MRMGSAKNGKGNSNERECLHEKIRNENRSPQVKHPSLEAFVYQGRQIRHGQFPGAGVAPSVDAKQGIGNFIGHQQP
jgi:hypothetical protein